MQVAATPCPRLNTQSLWGPCFFRRWGRLSPERRPHLWHRWNQSVASSAGSCPPWIRPHGSCTAPAISCQCECFAAAVPPSVGGGDRIQWGGWGHSWSSKAAPPFAYPIPNPYQASTPPCPLAGPHSVSALSAGVPGGGVPGMSFAPTGAPGGGMPSGMPPGSYPCESSTAAPIHPPPGFPRSDSPTGAPTFRPPFPSLGTWG